MKRFFTAFLAIVMMLSLSACGQEKEEENSNWNKLNLHNVLPDPHASKVDVLINSDEELYATISNFSESQYDNYIDACKEKGFIVDAEENSVLYEAFNGDGYKLNLLYNEDKLSISLTAPMKVEQIKWPKSDIASLLPVPESTVGKIEWEADYGFVIYVGDTSKEAFNEYADACAERGFTVDYERGDGYYYADNADGYQLMLRYDDNNIMFVRIDDPDDKEETPDTSEPSVNQTDETNEEDDTSVPASGIRPEFKEAMDSYEEFFDEYAAFMKKYAESGGSLSMLSDYMEFLDKYTETMEAMEAWGEEEMSTEETAYYLEVTTRINQKLLNSLS